MPLRGPDLSSDMRRFGVSVETPAYVVPTPDGRGCRLLKAACSPVAEMLAGRGLDPAPVAGRRLAGSEESPELASSLALRLPVRRLEALLTLPEGVLRLPADTVGVFFFLCVVTTLLWRVDRALIKDSSSCFSMMLRQGRVSVESVVFTATVCLVPSSSSSNPPTQSLYPGWLG